MSEEGKKTGATQEALDDGQVIICPVFTLAL